MPVEIKELNIKINVTPSGNSGGAPAGVASGTAISSHGGNDENAIISKCVEQVMELLKKKMER